MGLKRQRLSLQSVFAPETPEDSSEFPAFTPILADGLESMEGLRETRLIPSGSVLVEQGKHAASVQLIHRGLAKLVHTDSEGREVTIGLRSQGWYAGSISVLLKTPSVYSVRTVTPCRTTQFSAEDFGQKLVQNSKIMRHFTSVLCEEVTTQARMQVVMSSNARVRLEHFMRERASSHPSRRTLDPLPLLKQTEVAQLLSITPEHLSRVMEPLYSTKARGLGLGLAIARSILDKNKGSLQVASEPGQGSTFTVRLPAVLHEELR